MVTRDLTEPVGLLAEVLTLYRETVSAYEPLERLDEWEAWAAKADAWFREPEDTRDTPDRTPLGESSW